MTAIIYLFQMENNSPLDKFMKRRYLENDDRENISVDSGEIGQSSKRRKKISYTKKYDCSHSLFEFCPEDENGVENPLCVSSDEILSNDTMKPSTLNRHQHAKHSKLTSKPQEFFKRMRDNRNLTNITSCTLLVSYRGAFHIAKANKPYRNECCKMTSQ